MADKDYLDMSDDDFSKLSAPEPSDNQKTEKPQEETPEVNASEVKEELEPEVKTTGEDTDLEVEEKPSEEAPSKEEEDADELANGDPKSDASKSKDIKSENGTKVIKPDGSKTEAKLDKPETKSEDKTTATVEPDYKNFYEQIMKPFKANGREFKLTSPEEAVRMMQMGAGYGRKLQEIQPHLKTLKMLENNGLLDADKVSYLIDLHQKNPDAIKKLIKESGIDPLDINTSEEVAYQPGNHKVSDSQMKFGDAINEVRARPNGAQLVTEVYTQWDQKSKDALWGKPEVLGIIQEQRESGIYDLILAEIERQKLLGLIPLDEPFLGAYKAAGDALVAQHTKTGTSSSKETQSKVIETKAATVKPTVTNSDKAKAASPTQTNGNKRTKTVVNPFSMSDEDFLKQFGDRLG